MQTKPLLFHVVSWSEFSILYADCLFSLSGHYNMKRFPAIIHFSAYRLLVVSMLALRIIISFSVANACHFFLTIIVSLTDLLGYSTLCFTAQSFQNKVIYLMTS